MIRSSSCCTPALSRRPASSSNGRRIKSLIAASRASAQLRRALPPAAGLAQNSSLRGGESCLSPLHLGAAGHTRVHLRAIAQVSEQLELESPGDGGGIAACIQGAQRSHQKVEDRGVRRLLFGEHIHQLAKVGGVGEAAQVLAEVIEAGRGLHLCDHLQRAPDGELEASQGKELEPPGELAPSLFHALGDGGELAALPGEESDDAVGLAEVTLPDEEGRYPIDPSPAHCHPLPGLGRPAAGRTRPPVVWQAIAGLPPSSPPATGRSTPRSARPCWCRCDWLPR